MRINEDPYMRAVIDQSLQNERSNPAVAADVEYKPAEWTEEQTAELIERQHGDERERIDRLVAENNERIRRS
ncbi:hypothetical protein LG322_08450 [Microbacterium aerolatum]|uniref:hypothetical protein n=1 Tax=Microbacterium aerolatum TaxID=153731 RepID=UPI00384C5F55